MIHGIMIAIGFLIFTIWLVVLFGDMMIKSQDEQDEQVKYIMEDKHDNHK